MSEAFETDVQQPPGVSPLAVAGPVVLIFVIAAAVMAILVGAFWIKLGILPTEMAGVVRNSFPAPELQIDPLGDLQANRIRSEQQLKGEIGGGPMGGAPAVTAAEAHPSAPNSKVPEPIVGVSAAPQLANAERTSQQVGPKPAMSIKAAIARIASRPDPYAPLLPEGEVPDSAGQRAMSARSAARSGGTAARTQAESGSNSIEPAGARRGAMAPAAPDSAPSSTPGLLERTIRVPSESLQGTPTYGGTSNEGAVTR